jgi:hypothetical protein
VNNEDVVVGLPEHDGWRNAVASLDEDEGAYYSTEVLASDTALINTTEFSDRGEDEVGASGVPERD